MIRVTYGVGHGGFVVAKHCYVFVGDDCCVGEGVLDYLRFGCLNVKYFGCF